jgi:biotin carboxyl carrier protein
MRQFTATVGGKELEVSLDPIGEEAETPTQFQLKIGDTVRTVSARKLEPGSYSLLVDGRSYVVEIDGHVPDLTVSLCGEKVTMGLLDARRKLLAETAARAGATEGEGPALLRSPMPGKVVKVLCKPGDVVKAGAGLVVVEAMKMENELRAPRHATVQKVLVQEGQTVESGEELAQLE